MQEFLVKLNHHQLLDALPSTLPVEPCILDVDATYQTPLPDALYFSIFFVFGGGLYFLLLAPLSTRLKQWIAGPMLACLFIMPLAFSSVDSPSLQLLHNTACCCVSMRALDLYFVTPWRTGKGPTMNLEDWWVECWKPFRKIPLTKNQLQRQELQQQQADIQRRDENQKSSKARNIVSDQKQNRSSHQAMDPNPQHWSVYLPRWIFYLAMMDVLPFLTSFVTLAHVEAFPVVPRMLLTVASAMMVIFEASFCTYTLMIIWANLTGSLIRNTEWTLVTHYFPGLATSPADFWQQWHHLFQYIWVDLGYKPTHLLLRRHVTRKVANRHLAQALERVVPVLAVFSLSAVMHEYMVVGLWHVRPGHMTAFFLLQGVGTIISQALSSTIGRKVHLPRVVLIALTWIFNLSTATLFMTPVLPHRGYNLASKQSVSLHLYNLLRSNGVF